MLKSQWSGDCWEGEEGRGFSEIKAKLPVGRTGSMGFGQKQESGAVWECRPWRALLP